MTIFGTRTPKKTRLSRAAEIGASMTWGGRLRESLRNRNLVLRIALVLLTVIGLLAVTKAWRAPFRFRLNDRPEHGVQARTTFRRIDRVETERVRYERGESALPVYDVFEQGQTLVEPGEAIDEERLQLLMAEHEAVESQRSIPDRLARLAVAFILVTALAGFAGYFLARTHAKLVQSPGELSVYLLTLLMTVAVGRWASFDPWRAEVLPLLSAVMVLAVAYDQVVATITAIVLALLLTVSTVGSLDHFVILVSASATAILCLPRVSSRSTLILAGTLSGLVFALVYWSSVVLASPLLAGIFSEWSTWAAALRGLGWCLVAGYLVAGSLPFIERAFGVVTDISLLELCNISHPLLQELVRRAPGTYNHSVAVATIGEAAAKAIGANGLLVRVGAYFHDIGKMLKPEYFIENNLDGSKNRHDKLAPAMSTLIIIGHVKDGVDLAKQYNLPPKIIDLIEQHQGTAVVQYFYHAAARQAGRDPDHKTDAEESRFRYPGPKPKSKEAAVLMLADAVESASRTLSDPSPKRIESLVHDIVTDRLNTGQLDDSTLTLTEVRAIERSLTKSLIGIYHGRIKYPQKETKEKETQRPKEEQVART